MNCPKRLAELGRCTLALAEALTSPNGERPNLVQLRNSNRRWTQMNTDEIKTLSSSAFICG